jgi:hypothetical protein
VSENVRSGKPRPQTGVPVRSCNRCGGIPAIVRTMLNSTTGRTIRVYECSCGERTWLEDDSG